MKRLAIAIVCALVLTAQTHLSFGQAQRYALVIGITGYTSFPADLKLNYADDDAKMFYNFIQTPEGGEFPSKNIQLLLNEEATRQRIIEEINWLQNRVVTDDIVYIFFSGHAVTDNLGLAYFMPVNADRQLPEASGFRTDHFVEMLRLKISSKYMILFLDACHAGSAFNSGVAKKGPSSDITTAFKKAWEEAFRGKEALSMAFLSAAANQSSFEDPELGHGIFTWFLVEGMKGAANRTGIGNNDDVVTAGELYRYVLDKVEAHSQNKFGVPQSPTTSPEYTPSYPFAVTNVIGEKLVHHAENARRYFNEGYTLFQKGDLDGAIKACREAIRFDPNYSHPYAFIGGILQNKGDLDGAIKEYREAIRLNPNEPEFHSFLGNVFQANGDLDGAIKEYREAIRLDPNEAAFHSFLGYVLYDKGDLDGAIIEHREAIRLNPNDARLHSNLGNVLKDKGDLDGAIIEYQEAVRLNPSEAALRSFLGNALKAKNDLNSAIKEYREAIRLNPNETVFHSFLGHALYGKGDLDGAIKEFHEAIRLNPNEAAFHSFLGNALYRKGDLDGAIKEYRETIRLDSNDADSHYFLGSALDDRGDLEGRSKSIVRPSILIRIVLTPITASALPMSKKVGGHWPQMSLRLT